MIRYLWIVLVVIISGCSITKTVPSKIEYRLMIPEFTKISSSPCSDITVKLEPIQSSNILLDRRMYYVTNEVEQHYYTESLWSQSPNKMVEQIVKSVMIESQLFASVLDYRSNADTQWRYEIRILDFMQYYRDDMSSYVKLSMDFVLIKNAGREIIASKQLEATLPVETPDAKGGVLALNKATAKIVKESNSWLQSECQNSY